MVPTKIAAQVTGMGFVATQFSECLWANLVSPCWWAGGVFKLIARDGELIFAFSLVMQMPLVKCAQKYLSLCT